MDFTLLLDILRLLLRTGYWGIFLFMFLENTVLPFPSEVVLIFAGYFIYLGQMNFWIVVLVASLGTLAGAWLFYELARHYGERAIGRYGKYLFITEEHLHKANRVFMERGQKAVFFSRFIPVVRHVINIPAGTAHMPRWKFFVYTFSGAFVWNAAITAICVLLGNEWERAFSYFEPVKLIGILLAVCVITAGLIKLGQHLWRNRSRKRAP